MSAASRWLLGEDTGMSSKCMLRAAMGLRGRSSEPRDHDDFGRCVRMMAFVSDEISREEIMEAVSAQHPNEWGPLVSQWDRLERLYWDEKRHELYEALKEINWACRRCGTTKGAGRVGCPCGCGRMLCIVCADAGGCGHVSEEGA